MDSNTDDRDPEVQPDASPDELQEALRWLEEMAGLPSAGPDVSEAATEFPFEGLIDGEQGDLPDWLREAPPASADSPLTNDGEFESRLDWLAKMAERESIEELPTLEWRQLADATAPTDPAGSEATKTDWDTLPPFVVEGLPVEATPVEPLSAEAVVHLPPPAGEPEDEPAHQAELDAMIPALPDEVTEASSDLDAAVPITAEALLDTLPPDEELPPINDLDAAMAWIEELAASQDAPIEDVPSVADRALTSKLLMEAGLSSEGLELRAPGNELALGDLSLLEGSTPINSFVAEEDFADTIVLVETMAAEQGRPLIIPPSEPVIASATDEHSFDEAMAFLDDLAADDSLGAVTQPLMPIEMDAVETEGTTVAMQAAIEEPGATMPEETWAAPTDEAEVGPPPDESLSADDVPWATTELAEVVEGVEAIAAPLVDEPSPATTDGQTGWSAGDDAIAEQLVDEPGPATTDGQTGWSAGGDAIAEALVDEPGPATTDGQTGWSAAVAAEQLDLRADDVTSEDEMAPLPTTSESAVITANGDRAAVLEDTLRELDDLALPWGTSLTEIELSLHRGGVQPIRRDLPAAVEWLELALGISVPTSAPTPVPTPPLTDEDLVARMPDDPDAVLAWLEQMAEEDTVDSSSQLGLAGKNSAAVESPPPAAPAISTTAEPSRFTTEPLIDELSDADLLNMPEDPDAVMAWLEGLAAGAPTERREPITAPAAAETASTAPTLPEQATEPPAVVSRSRRRRGRKSQPLAVESPPTEPQMSEEPVAPVMDDVALTDSDAALSLPGATVEEAGGSSVEDGGVTAEVTAEIPDATVGTALEEGGLLVWPTADDTPDALVPHEAPADNLAEALIEDPTATYPVAPAVPARPRRRGRKPKAEAAPTTEPAVLVIDAVEVTSDEGAAGETEEAVPPPPEATPAKPASWVDLLKPLR